MATRIGKVLAIDYGDSRIGLALSDALGLFAHPLSTVDNLGYVKSAAEVYAIAQREEAVAIVIGLPLELDGTRGPQVKKVEKFARKLRALITAEATPIEVLFWDERMTSVHAERILAGTKLKGKEKHGAVDRIAAALILESYLATNRE